MKNGLWHGIQASHYSPFLFIHLCIFVLCIWWKSKGTLLFPTAASQQLFIDDSALLSLSVVVSLKYSLMISKEVLNTAFVCILNITTNMYRVILCLHSLLYPFSNSLNYLYSFLCWWKGFGLYFRLLLGLCLGVSPCGDLGTQEYWR